MNRLPLRRGLAFAILGLTAAALVVAGMVSVVLAPISPVDGAETDAFERDPSMI